MIDAGLYWSPSWLMECCSNSVPVCVWLQLFSLLISTSWSSIQHDTVCSIRVLKPVTRHLRILNSVIIIVCGLSIPWLLFVAGLPWPWDVLKHNNIYFLISWCSLLCTRLQCAFVASVLLYRFSVCHCHFWQRHLSVYGIDGSWTSVFNFDFLTRKLSRNSSTVVANRPFSVP